MSNLKLISHDFFSQMKKGIVENGDVMLYKDGAHVGELRCLIEITHLRNVQLTSMCSDF